MVKFAERSVSWIRDTEIVPASFGESFERGKLAKTGTAESSKTSQHRYFTSVHFKWVFGELLL